ncbi:MAG: NTP transferase domain-containing protein [Candidatus Cloacimonetes bacterium]|nr:NTP transferase domain-containing protein [Candidatus Cloacimonadota bacterium]
MKAVILAGGLGSRLRPFTEVIPKPLLPIGEKAVLEIQIEHLREHGFNQIWLATNYKSSYIQNFFGDGSAYGVELTISKEEKRLGTVGPLTLLKDQLTEPFLMMNGDILSLVNFREMYDFACKSKASLTVGTKQITTPFQFGNLYFEGDFVTGIEEKPDIKSMIVAGIYVLTPEIFKHIPDNEYYGIDQLILKMLDLGDPVAKYEIKQYWLDIGKIDDYEKAQAIYTEHFEDKS